MRSPCLVVHSRSQRHCWTWKVLETLYVVKVNRNLRQITGHRLQDLEKTTLNLESLCTDMPARKEKHLHQVKDSHKCILTMISKYRNVFLLMLLEKYTTNRFYFFINIWNTKNQIPDTYMCCFSVRGLSNREIESFLKLQDGDINVPRRIVSASWYHVSIFKRVDLNLVSCTSSEEIMSGLENNA